MLDTWHPLSLSETHLIWLFVLICAFHYYHEVIVMPSCPLPLKATRPSFIAAVFFCLNTNVLCLPVSVLLKWSVIESLCSNAQAVLCSQGALLCLCMQSVNVHLCMFFCFLFFFLHTAIRWIKAKWIFCIAKCKKAYCRERDLHLSVGLALMYTPAPQMSHPITQKNYTSPT